MLTVTSMLSGYNVRQFIVSMLTFAIYSTVLAELRLMGMLVFLQAFDHKPKFVFFLDERSVGVQIFQFGPKWRTNRPPDPHYPYSLAASMSKDSPVANGFFPNASTS